MQHASHSCVDQSSVTVKLTLESRVKPDPLRLGSGLIWEKLFVDIPKLSMCSLIAGDSFIVRANRMGT